MAQFQYIRVDKSLVVPATSVFSERDEFVNILCPGFDKPFSCGGEIADGLRSFLQGTRTFRVTANGVLDIYSGLVENLQAQQAFNGVSTGPITDVILDANTVKAFDTGPKVTQTPGTLNIDAIAKGIKRRSSYE